MTHTTDTNPINAGDTAVKVEQEAASIQSRLDKLQRELEAALDAFAVNNSFLTRAAAYWSEQPLWLQIGIGILLALLLVAINSVIHATVLLTLSVVALIAYSLGGFLLSDHHTQTTQNTSKFKEIMRNKMILLRNLVILLNNLCSQVATETERLNLANNEFKENISCLSRQAEKFVQQVSELSGINIDLYANLQAHDEGMENIEKIASAQSVQFAIMQQQLNQVIQQLNQEKQQWRHNQQQLTEQIEILKETQLAMAAQLEESSQTTLILQQCITSLSDTSSTSEENKQEFAQKLRETLEENKKNMSQILQHYAHQGTAFGSTHKNLQTSGEELNSLNQQYTQVLIKFENVIQQVETVNNHASVGLQKYGVFHQTVPAAARSQNSTISVPAVLFTGGYSI